MMKISPIPLPNDSAGILDPRFGEIFDPVPTPVAGSTEGGTGDEKIAQDRRSKTGRIIGKGYSFQLEIRHQSPVAGVDEAGCGPWAGPVVAAAFIFLDPAAIDDPVLSLIRDSKQLTPARREKAYASLTALTTARFGIGHATVEEIDQINIGQATVLAMQRAVNQLDIVPATALVDGIRKPDLGCPVTTVIKGDETSFSIAAASILAKVTRDRIMIELDKEFPSYGWAKNAGYGTAFHREALMLHGVTSHHRRSYAPIARILGV